MTNSSAAQTTTAAATTTPKTTTQKAATIATVSPYQQLSGLLKQLKLTSMLTHWEATESRALQQQWSYAQFLLSLCQQEADRRDGLRLKRAQKEAQLPAVKSLT
ncbi:MAG: ATP-binding protein, partial [Cyanobacteria bacterium J06627_15]